MWKLLLLGTAAKAFDACSADDPFCKLPNLAVAKHVNRFQSQGETRQGKEKCGDFKEDDFNIEGRSDISALLAVSHGIEIEKISQGKSEVKDDGFRPGRTRRAGAIMWHPAKARVEARPRLDPSRFCQKIPLGHVFDMVGTHRAPGNLGHCAVVGTGSMLSGSSLGAQIDTHDTVWRVNRLPSDKHLAQDLGTKTDVYFKNTLADYHGDKIKVRYLGNHVSKWCDVNIGGKECEDFKSLMYEGADKDFMTNANATFPLGHQTYSMHFWENNLKALGNFSWKQKRESEMYCARPSGGLKAFLSALMLCDSVDLYGFGGGTTLDGHRMDGHNFDAEHAFIDDLVAAKQNTDAYPKTWKGKWPSEFAAYSSRVQCMAQKHFIKRF